MFCKQRKTDGKLHARRMKESESIANSFIRKYGYLDNLKKEIPLKKGMVKIEISQLSEMDMNFLKLIGLYSNLIRLIQRHGVTLQSGVLALIVSYMNEEIRWICNMLNFENPKSLVPEKTLIEIRNKDFQDALSRLDWFSDRMDEIEEQKLFSFKDEKNAISNFISNWWDIGGTNLENIY